MTRNELPDDKKREYDAIVDRCMKEIEENDTESRNNTFSSKSDAIRQQITQKYLPLLNKILKDAEAAG